jgi:hypothetical protein
MSPCHYLGYRCNDNEHYKYSNVDIEQFCSRSTLDDHPRPLMMWGRHDVLRGEKRNKESLKPVAFGSGWPCGEPFKLEIHENWKLLEN